MKWSWRGLNAKCFKVAIGSGFKSPASCLLLREHLPTSPSSAARSLHVPAYTSDYNPAQPFSPASSLNPDERAAAKQQGCCRISATGDHWLLFLFLFPASLAVSFLLVRASSHRSCCLLSWTGKQTLAPPLFCFSRVVF